MNDERGLSRLKLATWNTPSVPFHILHRDKQTRGEVAHTRMTDRDSLSAGDGRSEAAEPAQAGLAAPPGGWQGAVQLDSGCDRVVQPFPRSPKLQRKSARSGRPSQEQLSKQLEELQAERSKAEAHIQSLKKRSADLSRRMDAMKGRVREGFENMRASLERDERAVLDSLELDLRQTRTRLEQVLKDWRQHLDHVAKRIGGVQRELSEGPAAQEGDTHPTENPSRKKPDASETEIRLNDEKFQRLLHSLFSIAKNLRAQLERKTLLLDLLPVMIDGQTCHSQIAVTPEGRGVSFAGPSRPDALEHPLRFDRVCCALGSPPIRAGRAYWEVDVRCCSAWAVGVAYASLRRRGRDRESKLGRNRNSWCVELRGGALSAWHNDRHVGCQGVGPGRPPRRVGVSVSHDRGQVTFYDADTMALLQRFSAAAAPVFDRAHHQFTEPLYPAVRFLKPPPEQAWPNHLEYCHLETP